MTSDSSISNIPENPNQIRQLLRSKRSALSTDNQNLNANKAFQNLKNWLIPYCRNNQTKPIKIAIFLAQDGELNTNYVIDYLWQNTDYEVFLPKLNKNLKGLMSFVPYKADSPMRTNQFGIMEPVASDAETLDGESLDIVIMPLVGFDRQGNRLGMGGGYYDRSFACKLQDSSSKPVLIGWAHQCQEYKKLPNEPWDVAMDGLVTEEKMTFFEKIEK